MECEVGRGAGRGLQAWIFFFTSGACLFIRVFAKCTITFILVLGSYVVTAGGVQEKELDAQTKHCSAKHEK